MPAMDQAVADRRAGIANSTEHASLCFVVDPDFGFLHDFSKSLRGVGVDSVEMVSSVRLAESVEDQRPDVVFVDVSLANPYECVRALLALKDCSYSGRVQLLGRCDTTYMESIRRIGDDAALTMLPVLTKPVDFATVRKIVLDQELARRPVPAPELSLREAIARDYLTFWYQPKIDLKQRQVVGAEAFARISHPRHGALSPGYFLAGATDEDLVALATRAVTAALKLSATLAARGAALQFAVNLGIDTLMKLPAADIVGRWRPSHDQWAGLLFEVTEMQALSRTIALRDKCAELERYGIALSIDNFGRMNSSFSMFRHLPFAEIKIDASFVQACASNRASANVCKSMIQTAHNFGRSAVAMGIETAEDAQELARLGCDMGQGYRFGRPMTEQQLITMVMTGRSASANFCRPSAPVASGQVA